MKNKIILAIGYAIVNALYAFLLGLFIYHGYVTGIFICFVFFLSEIILYKMDAFDPFI